jgi:3-hydroxyisobutyrate dehydrogenase
MIAGVHVRPSRNLVHGTLLVPPFSFRTARPCNLSEVPPGAAPRQSNHMANADQVIGLVGLGAVGSQLALCLADAGYSLLITDARPQDSFVNLLREGKGHLRWVSVEDLCDASDVVLTSLPSVAVIAKVAEGTILPRLSARRQRYGRSCTWIDLSTTDEEEVRRLGRLAQDEFGVDLIEAPLTGGVHLVRSGDMTVLCGCERAVMERHWELLNAIGGNVIHCGAWGTASVVKIISNMLAALHLVGVGEAFMLGKKYGIELPALWNALKASAGNSYVLETEGPFIMNGSFDTDFALKLHCKDLDIGYKLARALKSPLVLHGVAQQVYERARARYGDDAPSSLPAKLMEEDCGVKLQAPGFDGFTYQDRTSAWDRELKGGRWKGQGRAKL